ncbi:DUF1294 domain-containing protein [Psychromonas sp. psych-6C06]|uniref:DUF1294 domain-containing protein n=1 Tax=Psychromonas sp. psych-6C06 TaxID=2058089 RepID=UPI000C33D37D|nr:cold shock and DUF1294 domain-containing protein [Psychromonas sp. psych-6C06]PKF61046.1 DUF1294 domain-containing protein [Psychromonas sp. psych-6C06]
MKYQGKISQWNDAKGFGFVEPNGGGTRAFVHIKAFTPRSRRPINGEVITYQLVNEANNRYKAINIKFARDSAQERAQPKIHKNATSKQHKRVKRALFGSVLSLLFSIALLSAVLMGKLPVVVGFTYLIISLLTILAYAKDKYSAQHNKWRTPESTLHLLSVLGGWPGAMFAQQQLRHKTSKSEFITTYRLTVFINISALLIMYTEQGHYLLNDIILPLISSIL